MKHSHLFWLLLGLVILLLSAVFRPAWSPGIIGDELQSTTRLDNETRDWLRTQMRTHGIPGLSLALVIDGEVEAVESYGVSNYWTRTPVTPDTLFEVASNSKVVTALAAIRQLRTGALNLDQPLADYRSDYSVQGAYADQITLEMLLTHTAGLDNALGKTANADQPPGERFQYSGVGFELAGELIAHSSGTELADALRSLVLTPLGISDRTTYAPVGEGRLLASPHISISQPLLLFAVPCFVVFTLLALLVWVACRLGLIKSRADTLTLWTLSASVGLSVALPFLWTSTSTAMRFAMVDLTFVIALVALVVMIHRWQRTRSIIDAAVAMVLILAVVIPIGWHMPVPLGERAATSPAAAGLRANAKDMGRLLAALVNPPAGWEQDINELTTPRVRVNAENSWGLGIGIQQIRQNTTIWHWGVNYPGYHSLMLGLPDSGDGLVVLMNGGPIMFTPAWRYTALELARELAARVLPGPHGAYWYGVQ